MSKKAILITASNVESLTSRFQHDGTGVIPAIGYYLVAQFGEDGDYDILSSANFNKSYVRGEELRNGFFEALNYVPTVPNEIGVLFRATVTGVRNIEVRVIADRTYYVFSGLSGRYFFNASEIDPYSVEILGRFD